MKPVIFIQSNDAQRFSASVAAFSLKHRSAHPDRFDIRILRVEDYPFLLKQEGRRYARGNEWARWRRSDYSQSFVPLRFLPPQLMNYEGRALVIDPDIFAVADINELLERDMGGKAIGCRRLRHDPRGKKPNRRPVCASSVMLLDCAKLKHWKWEEMITRLFARKMNYRHWINLDLEPADSICELEEGWNHLDTLNADTKLIHFTRRVTQPWMTGLPYDRVATDKEGRRWGLPRHVTDGLSRLFAGKGYRPYGFYEKHPDPRQEKIFFDLFREAVESGALERTFVDNEIRNKKVRPDLWQCVEALV